MVRFQEPYSPLNLFQPPCTPVKSRSPSQHYEIYLGPHGTPKMSWAVSAYVRTDSFLGVTSSECALDLKSFGVTLAIGLITLSQGKKEVGGEQPCQPGKPQNMSISAL